MEKTINLSASICSLFAFIILIFEKSDYFSLSFTEIIAYIICSVLSILFMSLSIYLIQQYKKYCIENTKNLYLKICLYMVLILGLILYYIGTVGMTWMIATSITY